MTLSSSMNAGVSGLNVNATKLATISDNIANSKTFGYKRVDADFTAMTLSGRAGGYVAGGVRVASFRNISTQGSLITTANSMDIAIGGRGFLPVTPSSALADTSAALPLRLATTGSFRPDAEGILTTNSGLVLMGWPADADGTFPPFPRDSAAGLVPVNIAHNQFAANPTTEIQLGINLPATATQAGGTGDPFDLSIEYFDNLGTTQTMTATFTPQVPGVGQSNLWTMEITDLATGAAPIAEFTVQFDATTASGGSMLSVVPVYGGAYNAATGDLNVTFDRGPVDINIGLIGSNDRMTQLSSSFAPINLAKNGAPTGNVIGVDIDKNGIVSANYDSGFSKEIFRVPLIDVPNANALEALPNQTYAVTRDSGSMFLWDAGSGPTGETIGYAREESTTDIAGELTALIQTQRAYSSNAKIIQTVDEMLQETTNIKR
ncbi:MAG: flagellar hook-basal body complex protein [Rhodobacteraceae bacterium]|nr:flagellar hook-basal body complex protein [Paracoccaceae bacterium]